MVEPTSYDCCSNCFARQAHCGCSASKLGHEVSEEQVSRHYMSLLNTVNSVVLDKLSRKDYGGVFERYIQN